MVNTLSKARLEQMLEAYRRDFTPQHWDAEKYKWKAVKHFQDHWDLNARDFPEMLKFSLESPFPTVDTATTYTYADREVETR